MCAPELQTELSGAVTAAFNVGCLEMRFIRRSFGVTKLGWCWCLAVVRSSCAQGQGGLTGPSTRSSVRVCRAQQRCQVRGRISGSPGDSKSDGCGASQSALINSWVTWTQQWGNARLNGNPPSLVSSAHLGGSLVTLLFVYLTAIF